MSKAVSDIAVQTVDFRAADILSPLLLGDAADVKAPDFSSRR